MDLYTFLKATTPEVELSKEDIPEVERVISALMPLADRFWQRKINAAVDHLIERLQSYSEALGREEVDALTRQGSAKEREQEIDREVAALVATLEERLGCPLSSPEAKAVEDASRDLLLAGALAIGVSISLDSPRMVLGAQRDLSLLLSGRFASQEPKIREVVRSALTSRDARRALQPGGATRQALRLGLGSAWQTWGPQTVDAWAYRWHNVGRFLGGEEIGTIRWIARNPLDEKTTRFCRWVHGRTIRATQIRARLGAYLDAVTSGDHETMRKLWPLQEPKGTDARFRRIFGDLGLPPYHFRCRTVAVPA